MAYLYVIVSGSLPLFFFPLPTNVFLSIPLASEFDVLSKYRALNQYDGEGPLYAFGSDHSNLNKNYLDERARILQE
jgi:hypothetical protein